MIANYGYEDGSGFYYITIDGGLCARCADHACARVCPQSVFAVELDDYDETVAIVSEKARKRLRELCATCKGQNGSGASPDRLPCTAACSAAAIRHSW